MEDLLKSFDEDHWKTMLNDWTKVGNTTWKDLRDRDEFRAMEKGYKSEKWYTTLSSIDKQYVDALHAAQNKQGDRGPLDVP